MRFKVICISNISNGVDKKSYPLTIGKVYDTCDEYSYLGKYYPVVDDVSVLAYYDVNLFITLEEHRMKQINKIMLYEW